MKFLYLLPLPFLFAFSSGASADYNCTATYNSATSKECADAAGASSPEAFITAYTAAADKYKTSAGRINYTAGSCSVLSGTTYSCDYSWTFYGKPFNNSVSIVGEAAPKCPDTVEVRGPDSSVTKSGDRYYVTWSVRSVTSDICHNSCSYLASSASGSTCYLSPGSTSTGFCNYVVGLNSSSPSCGAESGYTSPSTGDPLTPNTDPGDGDDDGSDGGSGDGGNTGGGDSGGDGGSSFDGELSFSSPGPLDPDAVLDSELNSVHYKSFVIGMQADFNESEFGKALIDFQAKTATGASGGMCPEASIPILGTSVSFDSHCALFASISPILTAVFIAAWSLLAMRVFLSA